MCSRCPRWQKDAETDAEPASLWTHRKPLGDPPSPPNLALAVVLLIVVAIQAGFNAYQDFSTSRILDSITGMLPAEVTVTRDGTMARIPAADLVPGDIVEISLGQKVPADLRLMVLGGHQI